MKGPVTAPSPDQPPHEPDGSYIGLRFLEGPPPPPPQTGGAKGDSAPPRERTRPRGTSCERPRPKLSASGCPRASSETLGLSVARSGAQPCGPSDPEPLAPKPSRARLLSPRALSHSPQPHGPSAPRLLRLQLGPGPGPRRLGPSTLRGPALQPPSRQLSTRARPFSPRDPSNFSPAGRLGPATPALQSSWARRPPASQQPWPCPRHPPKVRRCLKVFSEGMAREAGWRRRGRGSRLLQEAAARVPTAATATSLVCLLGPQPRQVTRAPPQEAGPRAG